MSLLNTCVCVGMCVWNMMFKLQMRQHNRNTRLQYAFFWYFFSQKWAFTDAYTRQYDSMVKLGMIINVLPTLTS